MALLGKLLALVAIAAATPVPSPTPPPNTYNYPIFSITTITGLNTYPIIGGKFTITSLDIPFQCDPLNRNYVGGSEAVHMLSNGLLSGVQVVFPLVPQNVSVTDGITITGDLVLESSAVEASNTDVTFPAFTMSIDYALNTTSMVLGGAKCSGNGQPSQMSCAGFDAYGESVTGVFERTGNPTLLQLVDLYWNEE